MISCCIVHVRIGMVYQSLLTLLFLTLNFLGGSWLTGTRAVTSTPTLQCQEVKLLLVDLM